MYNVNDYLIIENGDAFQRTSLMFFFFFFFFLSIIYSHFHIKMTLKKSTTWQHSNISSVKGNIRVIVREKREIKRLVVDQWNVTL